METAYLMRTERGVSIPSMEPPPFSDGNNPLPRVAQGINVAFNGATAFQRWKRLDAIPDG